MSKVTEESKPRGYQKRDVNYRAVTIFGVALALTLIVVSFGMRALFGYYAKAQPLGPPPTPFNTGRALPPEPRLQVEPKQDLVLTTQEQDKLLDSYGWADQATGKVRIPIDRAMDLVLQHGLPVRQQQSGSPNGIGNHPPSASASGRH
jgi:hypothetical protein